METVSNKKNMPTWASILIFLAIMSAIMVIGMMI
jgi:hypothetical protein